MDSYSLDHSRASFAWYVLTGHTEYSPSTKMWINRYWNTLQYEGSFVKDWNPLQLVLGLSLEVKIQFHVLVGFDDADFQVIAVS